MFNNKTILVTGGTGSFGKKFVSMTLKKYNPLANWTSNQVWEYIKDNNVPYNPLHDLGYKSIGCQPCTRPTKPDEHARAGRWWWEEATKRECGLHIINIEEQG